jgi:Carboxypeptidase regulatory-like domain
MRHPQSFHLLLFLALSATVLSAAPQAGAIVGMIVDTSGTPVAYATVRLSRDTGEPDRETQTSDGGEFAFSNVSPGPFQLSVTAPGFSVRTMAGELRATEQLTLPPVTLAVAAFATAVTVTPTQAEIAQAQIREEEKQRVIGIFPNYFVNYDADAAPLNVSQKFELTWKGFVDPVAFISTAVGAAIDQARNLNVGFGRGGSGYLKRYGASYADFATERVIDKVLMPTLFKQDPRYFYKGTGPVRGRFFYAVSRSVICRGDNKRAQVCYSSLISHIGADVLTNYYYPPIDRDSTRQIFETTAIGIGGRAVENLFQEFIARKLTPKKHGAPDL